VGPWPHFIKITKNRELQEGDGGKGGERGGRNYKKAKVQQNKPRMPINNTL